MNMIKLLSAILATVLGAANAMATEEAKYDVIVKEGRFEVREYAPQILAETVVKGSMGEAGNKAFGRLFGYISGDNRSRTKIEMTAPVSQKPEGEKIKMTAPVSQQQSEMGWAVSFMMPEYYTLDALPKPKNPKVVLRQVGKRWMAAVRYSGRWTEKAYLRHEAMLLAWIQEKGYAAIGPPVWARYNAPFTPWFLRRNEVLIPIGSPDDSHSS